MRSEFQISERSVTCPDRARPGGRSSLMILRRLRTSDSEVQYTEASSCNCLLHGPDCIFVTKLRGRRRALRVTDACRDASSARSDRHRLGRSTDAWSFGLHELGGPVRPAARPKTTRSISEFDAEAVRAVDRHAGRFAHAPSNRRTTVIRIAVLLGRTDHFAGDSSWRMPPML